MTTDGTGKMPRDWPGFIAWALSPFRVFLFLFNLVTVFMVANGAGFFVSIGAPWCMSVGVPVLYGMGLLWVSERARE